MVIIDVIPMTGYYSTESHVEAIRKVATGYLDKPIQLRHFETV